MDHHVHAAITDGLRRRGVEVITAQEDGTPRFDDEQLLERATQLGYVLFSQDKDLLILTHRWLQTDREFVGLVYAHQLSVTIGQAVRDLELIAKALDPQDMRNHIEFIPP
jgi:predicted nuclease of predicted toxin-antitoxin system